MNPEGASEPEKKKEITEAEVVAALKRAHEQEGDRLAAANIITSWVEQEERRLGIGPQFVLSLSRVYIQAELYSQAFNILLVAEERYSKEKYAKSPEIQEYLVEIRSQIVQLRQRPEIVDIIERIAQEDTERRPGKSKRRERAVITEEDLVREFKAAAEKGTKAAHDRIADLGESWLAQESKDDFSEEKNFDLIYRLSQLLKEGGLYGDAYNILSRLQMRLEPGIDDKLLRNVEIELAIIPVQHDIDEIDKGIEQPEIKQRRINDPNAKE